MINKDVNFWGLSKELLLGLILFFLVVLPFTVIAQQAFHLEKTKINNGQVFVRIYNKTPYFTYCILQGRNYFRDFYINPKQPSRWYPEPYGAYKWNCK